MPNRNCCDVALFIKSSHMQRDWVVKIISSLSRFERKFTQKLLASEISACLNLTQIFVVKRILLIQTTRFITKSSWNEIKSFFHFFLRSSEFMINNSTRNEWRREKWVSHAAWTELRVVDIYTINNDFMQFHEWMKQRLKFFDDRR